MPTYRSLEIGFYDDEYISSLSDDEYRLYTTLICHDWINNNIGFMEINLPQLAASVKQETTRTREIMEKLEGDGKIVRDGNYLLIKNFMKHQEVAKLPGVVKENVKFLPTIKQKSPRIFNIIIKYYGEVYGGLIKMYLKN